MAPSPDPLSVWNLPPGHPGFAPLAPVDVNDHDRLQPFDGSPMAATWTPVAAFWDTADAGRPIPDIASIVQPALAERGLNALGNTFGDSVEALPLDVADGPAAWMLNVTHLSDALDEDASELERFPDSDELLWVDRYAFDPARLSWHTIFKLRQSPRSDVFVTGAVVARILDAGLTGADPRQVWAP